ncbi:ribosome biogenesis GTPase [Litoreibacter ponti]|uniref:Small ribosomal subunit biogenesis GTPase RsgA n=1 Tax=Litoreibacter ponti TaxID=1510457 RepID=A0A2T6BMH1_9RHOB|nr:ribosome small subunit-dependent GTPase A [Litoreibacter ponti]PTX57256.1 ribosome biogenesis GTPase [Litoreibacter ponti]
MSAPATLAELGWRNFFMQQLDVDELGVLTPARVTAVHRAQLEVLTEDGPREVLPYASEDDPELGRATVGDWLLLTDSVQPVRLLERASLFKRKPPLEGRRTQLIAANLDTLFVVTSCNRDFNVARLERYLAMAADAEVTPVIVLTKVDQAEDADSFIDQARAISRDVQVEALNAKDPAQASRLLPWCGLGQTVAFVGSSGVGKSTLVNTLTDQAIETQGIREADARGRHTTTHREMHRLPSGGWLIDTPGMRELQLTDVQAGIEELFGDIEELALACKFRDCAHESEPGCAVRAAVEAGALDQARVDRWRKLAAEEAHNTATVAERHRRDRAFGKMVKDAMSAKRRPDRS